MANNQNLYAEIHKCDHKRVWSLDFRSNQAMLRDEVIHGEVKLSPGFSSGLKIGDEVKIR